jgi:heme exporter protein C
LMLRQAIEDPSRRARFGAVYGIVAFASVIMTFLGVRLIESTIHPAVIGQSAATSKGDFGLAPRMLQTMLFNFLTFTFVYVTLVWHRVRLAGFADQVNLFRSRLYAE